MVVTARRRFPSIAIWQQPNFDLYKFHIPALLPLKAGMCYFIYVVIFCRKKMRRGDACRIGRGPQMAT